MITLTVQLAIWLGLVCPGFLASLFSAFRTYGRLQVLRHFANDGNDVVLATSILFYLQCVDILSWSVGVAIGLAALFDTNAGPVGQTLIGELIVAGILLFVGLLAVQTTVSFLAGEQLHRRAKDRLSKLS